MTTFEVYKHPVKGYVAVKIGFSWPALFFGFFWALFKKLWAVAGILFFATIGFEILFSILLPYTYLIDHFTLSNLATAFTLLGSILAAPTIMLFAGFKGNSWIKNDLIKRGYSLLKTIESTSCDASIATAANNN